MRAFPLGVGKHTGGVVMLRGCCCCRVARRQHKLWWCCRITWLTHCQKGGIVRICAWGINGPGVMGGLSRGETAQLGQKGRSR